MRQPCFESINVLTSVEVSIHLVRSKTTLPQQIHDLIYSFRLSGNFSLITFNVVTTKKESSLRHFVNNVRSCYFFMYLFLESVYCLFKLLHGLLYDSPWRAYVESHESFAFVTKHGSFVQCQMRLVYE